MSNAGQAVLTIAGYAVGSFFGYPQLGLYVGGLVGQAAFPTQLPDQVGPRLLDLTVQTSTVGAPIPIIFGTHACAGNIIWSSGLLETESSEDVGGKGGGSQTVTTFSYRASFAIGLCEGPILGVRRIWADSRLIYDVSRPIGVSQDTIDAITDAVFEAFTGQLAASAVVAAQMQLYLGTEDQDPDPTIEAYEGVGMVPGFRGLAYLVFTDFQLADYGNRIPNFRIEVIRSGGGDCIEVVEYENEVLYPWVNGDYPVNPDNLNTFSVQYAPGDGVYDRSAKATIGEALTAAATRASRGYAIYSGYRTLLGDNAGVVNRIDGPTVLDYDTVSIWLHYSSEPYDMQVRRDGILSAYMDASTNFFIGTRRWSNGPFSGGSWGSGGAVYLGVPYGTTSTPVGYDGIISGSVQDQLYYALARDALIRVTRAPTAPPDPCSAETLNPSFSSSKYGNQSLATLLGAEEWCALGDGTITPSVPWTLVNSSSRVLQRYQAQTINGRTLVTKYPLGPARPVGHAQYNDQPFWEAAYAEAVAAGDMAAGLVYGVDYPVAENFYYTRTYNLCVQDASPVTLASIVEALCARVGLTNVDVSDLEYTLVDGYMIGRQMSSREACEQLRSFGFFDGVESNGVAKFVMRGHDAVATIAADDLAAHEANSQRPTAMEVARKLDFELPRMVRVHYTRPQNDYEPGEQYDSRLVGDSVHVLDVNLAIAMSDDKAKQISQVLLYEAWIGRSSYRFTLDHRHMELEPTDCVNVPVDGVLERLRIMSIDHSLPTLLAIEATRDDATVYSSVATGAAGQVAGSQIAFSGPTVMELLDIPALRDADDDAGYYAALRPAALIAPWRGAVISRSQDGGASYTHIGAATSSPVVGRILAELPTGPTTVFDEGNTLQVALFDGTLESRTEDAVLGGANAAAIGAHGRWEIIQFRDAVLQDGIWTLTGLLRGRRGTEHALGSSEPGDAFVFLSGGGLIRLPLENAAIGQAHLLKATTFGAAFTSDETTYPFTGAGVALKPFSPVSVSAVLEADGDVRISWIRRGRLSQELRDGADIPLSEASEAYEVDVLVDGVVVRTISTGIQSATYTAAQQVEDFGSPPPSSIVIRVYQISEVVGRGYPSLADGDVNLPEITIDLRPELPPVPVVGESPLETDAIIFTGEAREGDVNGTLTWERTGDAPYISDRGFVGDGYTSRYLAVSPALASFGSSGSATSVASVATIAGLTFGAPSPGRLIAACISYEADATIVGVTIGGVAAVQRAVAIDSAGAPDNVAAIWVAEVPTGLTGDVIVTLSTGDALVAVSTVRVVGASVVPSDSDTNTGSAASLAISALTIPVGGVGIAAFCNATAGTGVTWTGATEVADANFGSAYRGSTALITTEGTNTVTADGATAAQALCGIAFAPSTPFPAWLSSSSGPLMLRATVDPIHRNQANTDVIVSACENDAAPLDKLALVYVDDVDLSTEGNVAVRAYTSAAQTQRIARRNWRFHWPFPLKELGGFDIRTGGIALVPNTDTMLVAGHFEATVSHAYLCNRSSGEATGVFEFDGTHLQVSGLAYRESDGTYWAADFDTGDIQRFDLEASLAAGVADVDLTFTVFADDRLASICWAEIAGTEYLLALETSTAGTLYIYVIDPADVIDGQTFNTANRVKRMNVLANCQGIAYRDGILYLSVATGTGAHLGGDIVELDFDTFLASGVDGDSYTLYEVGSHIAPARFVEDLDFDEDGRLWTMSNGRAALGDDLAFACVWSSALGFTEQNTYQAFYDGAGLVTIKVNDRLFATQAWTPTIAPAALTIGGPPQASAGRGNGFFSGRVWNVVIQEGDLSFSEFDGPSVIYDSQSVEVWDVPLENPDAETGDGTGWTIEVGGLEVEDDTGTVNLKFGDYYFWGGDFASSIVRQRFDIEDLIEQPAADLLASGDAWVILEWWGCTQTSQNDFAVAGARFLDADLVELAEESAVAIGILPNNSFAYRAFSVSVPAGARYLDVLMTMTRGTGTPNNAYWDEFSATLFRADL